MSKARWQKPVEPSGGRMVNGYFKSDYDEGFDAGLDGGLGRRNQEFTTVPLCLEARSRSYWAGYRKAFQQRNGMSAKPIKAVRTMRTRQMRALHKAVEDHIGPDAMQAYLGKGWTIPKLAKMLGAI